MSMAHLRPATTRSQTAAFAISSEDPALPKGNPSANHGAPTLEEIVSKIENKYGETRRGHYQSDDDLQSIWTVIAGVTARSAIYTLNFSFNLRTAMDFLLGCDEAVAGKDRLYRALDKGPCFLSITATEPLYAALDTRSGEILGKTAQRHNSTEFVDFLAHVVASQPPGHEIHVIADNLSAHKTKLVEDFLANPQVRIILHPPILPGLTKSKSGSPKFIGRSSLEASFLPSTIPQKNPSLHPRLQQDCYPIKWTYSTPAKPIGV